MTSISSYNNDKVVTGEVEYPACDPASGAFFQADYKKNGDLKLMLDGSKDSLKLEAMKRIIGMIAKGRDASDLFPAVVKNVVSKNIEVKKLVYVYLVRYAEEQQDLALLSISTFQRALKDPNQLIRASALRILSSIRVPMIVPIVMLAIRDSASDMSPYVRKTAAHAIPKLYSLDPDQKEELVAIIDKLLSDKAPLVVGSAAMAFSEVCPDRMSLIHKSYRKLCSLLADVDEWGQLSLLNVLTVYAMSCFPDPNTQEYSSDSESDKPFYTSESDEPTPVRRKSHIARSIDPDHRLLLRAARPLLQSRNSGVVLAVSQLYYHTGPAQELPPIAKAMVRLLRAPTEVQSVVLNCIASLTVTKPSLFEPFLKSFFVRTSDRTNIKLLKLEILTNLATETSATAVLRELQTYVTSNDKAFAGATIQAIGRLAIAIHSETETCLNGLLHLLASKDEWVVCEAVVVVKRVVGGGAAPAAAAVARAARLLRTDRLAPSARAAAIWLVAEHGADHPRAAAILAHMAANFSDQDELVKLQLLSLAVKLSISQPDTMAVCRYVVSLARYDGSYDVRDRARLLRAALHAEPNSRLAPHLAKVFRPEKPKPAVHSSFRGRSAFAVGSLSQCLGVAAAGYRALPTPPAATVSSNARELPVAEAAQAQPQQNTMPRNKSFYSEPGSSSGSSSSSGDSSSSEESSEEEASSNEEIKQSKPKEINSFRESNSGTSDSDSDSSDSSDSSDGSEESDESDNKGGSEKATKKPVEKVRESKQEKSNLELLLELESEASSLPTMTPTCGGFLSPQSGIPSGVGDGDSIVPVGPSACSGVSTELVGRTMWRGVSVSSRWTRAPHLYSPALCSLQLALTNHNPEPATDIRLHKKPLTGSRAIHEFAPIPVLAPGATVSCTLGIDFADTIQPVEFTLAASVGEVSASITPPIGELIRAVQMPVSRWDKEHRMLRGMTECTKKAVKLEDEQAICKRVFEAANVAAITSSGDFLRFAGRLISSQDLVLLSVKIDADSNHVTANCSNMAIASLLANEIAQAFARS